jgi:uncharacterized membrane protein
MPMWLIPMIYVAGAFVAGVAVPRLEHQYFASYFNDIAVGSALAFTSSIASGMMALTAIVFSIAYVAIQFSAVAYSPRMALLIARSPGMFHANGLFMATFIYALSTTLWIDRGGSGGVPLLSGFIVSVLLAASMLMFVRLLRSFSGLLVTGILQQVGDRGRAVIYDMFQRLDELPLHQSVAEPPELGAPVQVLRYDGPPRSVARFDVAVLVRLAVQADAVIEIPCAVGDTVVDTMVLVRVHRTARPLPERALLKAIRLASERTFEQDPKYPIRLLVDIAIKALSAAINDPTTAVQALDQLEDLMHRLGRRELDAGYGRDAAGTVRVIFPMPNWEDYLRLAFDEIRHYGAGSVQVMRRLRSALLAIAEEAPGGPRTAIVERYLKQLDLGIERAHHDPEDRAIASQEDRQGLGVSRKRSGTPGTAPRRDAATPSPGPAAPAAKAPAG